MNLWSLGCKDIGSFLDSKTGEDLFGGAYGLKGLKNSKGPKHEASQLINKMLKSLLLYTRSQGDVVTPLSSD